jgi:hypothetical protein
MLPKGCYERLRDCKITHKQYGPVTAIAWWAMIKKSLYFWLPIFHRVRKPVIIILSVLRSKRFSVIRKAGALTSTKAICHARSG